MPTTTVEVDNVAPRVEPGATPISLSETGTGSKRNPTMAEEATPTGAFCTIDVVLIGFDRKGLTTS
jgi:hypothetical protein